MSGSWSIIFQTLLFGRDRADPIQRSESISTTQRSNSAASTSSIEITKLSAISADEKESTPASQNAQSPHRRLNPAASRTPSWPSLLRSSGVSSIFTTFQMALREKEKSAWQPSFCHPHALLGLCATAVAIGCVFGSLIILKVSDGQPTDDWPVQPMVYLAIVAAISNSALRLAHTEAIPISWWYHATKGGSVRALERHWEVSNSLVRAIIRSRHFSLLNVVCIMTCLAIIDAPLLQRATTVQPATISEDVTLHLVLPPELPRGFSGYVDRYNELQESNDFWFSSEYWTKDVPIAFNASECGGSCRATVHGPAIAKTNCTSETWPITPDMTHSFNATWGTWKGYYEGDGQHVTNNPAFYVSLSVTDDATFPRQSANLTAGLVSWTTSGGSYVQTTCELVSAIGEYDVLIENGNIALTSGSEQGRIVRLANNAPPVNLSQHDAHQWDTLDAITQWLAIYVNANATVGLASGSGHNAIYSVDTTTFNPQVVKHMNFSMTAAEAWTDMSFVDPTPDILLQYNQLMFRGAVFTVSPSASQVDFPLEDISSLLDPDVSVKQTVQARQILQRNVFHTDLRWYAGAAVFEIASALLILPMFWGFWTLGKPSTLSPFGIALAFDSPLLSDVPSAAGTKGVVGQLGGMRLKYGVVDGSMGPMDHDQERANTDAAAGRLGFARAENVLRPRPGMQFSS